MSRLEALSILTVIVLPVLFLLFSLYIRSLGFFFYSFAGAVTPGLTGYLISLRKTP
jgi:hypothetical protein